MQRRSVFLALVLASTPAAAAFTGTSVTMRDGPAQNGRSLAPVWYMHCADADRLVGLRIHGDEARVDGAEAICAPLRDGVDGIRWLGEPRLAPEPPPPPPPVYTTEANDGGPGEGTVLEASSSGVRRYRSSHAELITIRRQPPQAADDPAIVPSIAFRDGDEPTDLMCPRDSFVTGLRIGTGSAANNLAAVQIICGNGTIRPVAIVGDWPADKPVSRGRKGRKAKAEIVAQRIECSRAGANPHDGDVGQAIFGTAEDGRIATLGLSCAKGVDDGRQGSPTFARTQSWLDRQFKDLGGTRTYNPPKWFDGAGIAACAARRHARACDQQAADDYCGTVAGYRRASSYVLGDYARDAVSAGGKRCAAGTCRVFASLTCSFAAETAAN